MRCLITSLLCFCLAVPTNVFADQFMDAAKKTVEEMNRAADNFIDAKIQMDIQSALADSMNKLIKLKSTDEKIVNFQKAMANLQTQFDQLINNPSGSYEVTRQSVQEAVDAYTALYSSSIDQSWVPMSIDRQFESVPFLMQNSLQHLKDRCAAGDWSEQFDMAIRLGDALPAYEFDYNIYIGTGGDLSSINYTPHNYIEKDQVINGLNTATGIAFTATSYYAVPAIYTSLTTGAAYGAGATGMAGTMIAAFPYAVVAVVIMAVVSGYAASRKKEKMARKRLAADYYKLNNTRRSMWLKTEYQERCGDMVQLIEPVLKDLGFIAQNMDKPEAIDAYYADDIEDLEKSKKIFLAFKEAKCQQDLNEEYKNKKCVTFEEMEKIDVNQYMREKKMIPRCFIRENTANILGCALPISTESDGEYPLTADWEKVKADIQTFEDLDGGEEKDIVQAIAYVRSLMRDMFVENYARFRSQISDYAGNGIYKSRQQAFVRLQKLIGVYQNTQMAPQTALLQQELDAFRTYSKLREEHLELVAVAIDVIFEKADREVFVTRAIELRNKLEPFYNQYVYIPEVSDLMGHFVQLEKTMGLTRLQIVTP